MYASYAVCVRVCVCTHVSSADTFVALFIINNIV